jgi:hypothetical protein
VIREGNISLWVILALVILLFLQRECGGRCDDCPEIQTEVLTDTIPGDSVPYPVPSPIPDPEIVYQDTGRIDSFYLDVDTAAILKDYFASVIYTDTINEDSSFFAVIHDTLSRNRLIGRSFFFQNLRPISITTITNTVEGPPKLKLFLGPLLSYSNDTKNLGVGGSVLLMTKRDNGYAYSYDFLNRQHQVVFYWKLKFKK